MAYKESVEEAFRKGLAAGEGASSENPYQSFSREWQAWDRGFANGTCRRQAQGGAAPSGGAAQDRRMIVKAHLAAGCGLREAWAAADRTEGDDDDRKAPVGFV